MSSNPNWRGSLTSGTLVEIKRSFSTDKPCGRGVILDQIGDSFYAISLEGQETGTSAYGAELKILAYPSSDMLSKLEALDLAHHYARRRLLVKEGFKLPVDEKLSAKQRTKRSK
ncbi:MAG: hypothetical protein JWO15_3613 [Sphingomonadales bacterium]|nr:hypothetical protein [Sphingomonadales bacterium]